MPLKLYGMVFDVTAQTRCSTHRIRAGFLQDLTVLRIQGVGSAQYTSGNISRYTVTRFSIDYVNTYSSEIATNAQGLPGPLSVNSYRYEAENQYTADHNAYYYPISTTGYNPGNPRCGTFELSRPRILLGNI